MTTEIVARWMSFREEGDQILALRHRVFLEEQGSGSEVVSALHDAEGVHLGAFSQGELIAMVSAHIHDGDPAILNRYHLPPTTRRVLQITKCASRSMQRIPNAEHAHMAAMLRSAYETLYPECVLFVLEGKHRELKSHYIEMFDFQSHTEIAAADDSCDAMVSSDPQLRTSYLRWRQLSEAGAESLGMTIPSLVSFLELHQRMDLVALAKLNEENLYTAPLSLKDELPRLSAQTRMLYLEQKARLGAVQFPPAPAKLLDVGAGPGVYLSLLKRQPQFRGYEVTGLDISSQMVFYARLNRPDIKWLQANVYDTREPAQTYDVVHANMVFLHLLNPAVALREIHRIMKPGGIFYILDINDARFEGPPAIATLIRNHADLHLGNRRIMSTLPQIAEQHGFQLTQRFATSAKSSSTQQEATVQGDDVHINRILLWGLFSFMGQREELAAQFKDAQEVFFNSNCEISVCLETHIYKRL